MLRRVAVVDAGRLSQYPGDRPERDPLAVGQTPSPEHRRAVRHPFEELLAQPRLADARGADQRHDRALRGPLDASFERGELLLAPDERRVEPPCPAWRGRVDLEHPESADGLPFALQSQR